MESLENLIQSFQRVSWVIAQQAKGLTHEDMMLQLPFRSNCFNWVLGHVVNSRYNILNALGETAVSSKKYERYGIGSDPVSHDDSVIQSEQLLTAINETQEQIANALKNASPDLLNSIHNEERNQTVLDFVTFLQWHESYHCGQFEILRQLAGTDDAII